MAARLTQTTGMTPVILISLIVLAGIAVIAFITRQRAQRRQSVIRSVLDAADALEAQLRTARSAIEAVAGDEVNPVRAAMEDLLQQRLWLRENAGHASVEQLDKVRRALDAARSQLELQLQQIDHARTGH